MTRLALDLLGTFAATLDGRAVNSFRSNKVRALLAFLAMEADRGHTRVSLAALFWPETSDLAAARNLRLTLHRLRRTLDEAAGGASGLVLRTTSSQVQLNGAATSLDAAIFMQQLAEVRSHAHSQPELCAGCLERLERAVALYRGELLAGFGLSDAPLFEEWLLVEREHLKRECIWALHSLAVAYDRRADYERALAHASRQVQMDPYREEAYRQMMRSLALSDRRSEAVASYLACKHVLAEELGIEPDGETTALYLRIIAGDVAQLPPAPIRLVNFPVQFTPLVGREAELQTIRARLLDPGCRLLTLTGMGGVGKTRLAVEAATRLASEPHGAGKRFTDGLFFVSLASVASPEYLPSALAIDLKLPPHDGAPVGDQVVDFLRHKRMLLVLDNVEHLRESAVWLRSVLEAAPGVEMLVTSRLPLDLLAEERLAIDGLGYSPASASVESALDYPAVRLFVQAARRVQQDFRLSPANVQDVARIGELVDGRPLALEIAASWLRVYDSADIVREIERSFEFLATTLRDVPVRHRSVRIVFDHTWELLSPAQQRALANLAVFRGPFKMEAALAVADATVVDVASLLDAALVQRRASGWYEVHFLLRQFALQQVQHEFSLEESFGQALRRHSDYYLAYVAARESALTGPAPNVALAQIYRRLDDIRQAWRLAGEQAWLPGLEQSLEGLAHFYELSGLTREGARMLDLTAARLRELQAGDAVSTVRVTALLSRLLAWRSHFLEREGRTNEAIDLVLQALALAGQAGEQGIQSEVASLLGQYLPHRGEFAQALSHQEQAIAWFRAAADERRLAPALTRLGVIHWRRGSYGAAQDCLEEALALQQRLQNSVGMARILQSLGGVAFEQRKYSEALRHAMNAREIYESIGNRSGVTTLDGNLALLSHMQGNYEEAQAFNKKDLDYVIETGNRHGETVALGNRGAILLDAGRLDEALACFQRCVLIQEELGNKWEVARHRASIAGVRLAGNEPAQALADYARALPDLRSHGAPFYLVGPLLSAAGLLIDAGNLAAATEHVREGDQLAVEMGLEDQVRWGQILEARLAHAGGDRDGALARLRQLAEQAGDPEQQALARFWLWKVGQAAADRAAAVALYDELYRQLPKYDYRLRLDELHRPLTEPQ